MLSDEKQELRDKRPRAAMIAIGDELLSGRTRDANIHTLAKWLTVRGVDLVEVRIVPDIEDAIVSAVNALRCASDFVVTSGGIGPTHDDITADAIGTAFDVEVSEREDALEVLKDWYAAKGEEVNDRRRRMARVPTGARLIANSVSGAPGFVLENVYVLAGVPAIFNAMLEAIDEEFPRGALYIVYTVTAKGHESLMAEGLIDIENKFSGVKIGSYPGKSGVSGQLAIVCQSLNADDAAAAAEAVAALFRERGAEPKVEKGFADDREA